MTDRKCEDVLTLLPDRVSGRLDAEDEQALDEHLKSCSDCALEEQLARVVHSSRRSAPGGLEHRVLQAIRGRERTQDRDRERRRLRPWWGISAAAVAALALGIGMSSEPTAMPPVAPGFATELDEGELWSSDDGLFAGAPSLEELSDEALVELLDELSAEGIGGAA